MMPVQIDRQEEIRMKGDIMKMESPCMVTIINEISEERGVKKKNKC